MKRPRYYRVELFINNASVGGFVSPTTELINKRICAELNIPEQEMLEITNNLDDEKYNKLLAKVKQPFTLRLVTVLNELVADLEIPAIYKQNSSTSYCFFKENTFNWLFESFDDLDDAAGDMFSHDSSFKYLSGLIPKKDIIYEDEDQIVVTKEAYDKFKQKAKPQVFPNRYDWDDDDWDDDAWDDDFED